MATKIRESTGGGFRDHRGRLFVRVTIGAQQRKAEHAPWATELEQVQERGRVVQAWVNRLRAAGQVDFVEKVVDLGAKAADAVTLEELGRKVDALAGGAFERVEATDPRAPVTFKRFAEQWTSGELHRLYPDHVPDLATADDNEQRLRKWVFPVAKDVRLKDFTLEHAQEVMRRIPREKSPATRRHVAQLMVRVLNLAVYPCRHIEASPLPRGFLPKLGPAKALSYLYPDEDAKLMACTATGEDGAAKVPLVHRVLYGFLAREGMRSDEAQSLQWRDLDVERGVVRLDENKTDDPRGWTLDAGVAAALTVWREMVPHEPTDSVFPGLTKPYALAEQLRDHMHAAGIDRAELFETSKARRRMRVHDLRATFVTLSLANGRTETWVADRTGHKSSVMINRYRRVARTAEELGLGCLDPLAMAVPEIASRCRVSRQQRGSRPKTQDARRAAKSSTSPKLRRRDSNPDKRNQKAPSGAAPRSAPRDSAASAREAARTSSESRSVLPRDAAASDPVEAALAKALEEASAALRWDVVARVAGELEARRQARAGNVVSLDVTARRRRA